MARASGDTKRAAKLLDQSIYGLRLAGDAAGLRAVAEEAESLAADTTRGVRRNAEWTAMQARSAALAIEAEAPEERSGVSASGGVHVPDTAGRTAEKAPAVAPISGNRTLPSPNTVLGSRGTSMMVAGIVLAIAGVVLGLILGFAVGAVGNLDSNGQLANVDITQIPKGGYVTYFNWLLFLIPCAASVVTGSIFFAAGQIIRSMGPGPSATTRA